MVRNHGFNKGKFELMRYIIFSVFILFLSSSAFGEEEMECQDRDIDPSKFCLPGQAWNERVKKCVNLV